MKSVLTPRQRQILAFIRDFAAAHNRPPTVREIQHALNISSTSVVDYNLNKLEEKGELRRNRNISRGIEIAGLGDAGSSAMTVPIVGTIAAGQPIEVPDTVPDPRTWGETVKLDPDIFGSRTDDVFALRVKGNSMIDALIADGDIVLMRPQRTAENGETVAVWLNSDKTTTLKRFYREGRQVRLQPANVTMAPIYVAPDDVEIQGKLLGVVRRLAH